jgi:hypothetical protein
VWRYTKEGLLQWQNSGNAKNSSSVDGGLKKAESAGDNNANETGSESDACAKTTCCLTSLNRDKGRHRLVLAPCNPRLEDQRLVFKISEAQKLIQKNYVTRFCDFFYKGQCHAKSSSARACVWASTMNRRPDFSDFQTVLFKKSNVHY